MIIQGFNMETWNEEFLPCSHNTQVNTAAFEFCFLQVKLAAGNLFLFSQIIKQP